MDQRLLKVDEDDRAEEGGAEVSQPPPHRPRAPRVVPAEGAAKDVVTALTDPRNNEDEEDREPEEDHEEQDGPGPGQVEAQAYNQENVTKEVEEEKEEI